MSRVAISVYGDVLAPKPSLLTQSVSRSIEMSTGAENGSYSSQLFQLLAARHRRPPAGKVRSRALNSLMEFCLAIQFTQACWLLVVIGA